MDGEVGVPACGEPKMPALASYNPSQKAMCKGLQHSSYDALPIAMVRSCYGAAVPRLASKARVILAVSVTGTTRVRRTPLLLPVAGKYQINYRL